MLTPMRLALIAQGGFDAAGRDMVPALVWLVERLARRHDVHVFVLHYYREPRTYPLAGATIHDVGRVDGPPGLRRLRLAARLRRAIVAAGRFDVLHAYWGLPAALTADVGAALHVPVVTTLDSGELVACEDIGYGLQRRWLDRRAVARAIRRAARVTVSTAFMAGLPALGGIRPDIVPIGVDTQLFRAGAAPAGPPWRLLRVASLNQVKDYPTLLRALTVVAASLPSVHLDIVGADTLDGSIQRLAGELGLGGHVTFHGFQPTAALPAFYGRAHLHVLSSRHEAANVATLEAAASGVPTVGTDVGYVADWAAEGRSVAVPVADHHALAAAIAQVLQDTARRQQLAAAARAWTLAHDADWSAAAFERLYAAAARNKSEAGG
jgi:glycosyltransferase involved in cell wall biosynthesis